MTLARACVALCVAVSTPVFGSDGKLELDPSKTSISWQAVGTPGFLKIDGKGGTAGGALVVAGGKVSGTVKGQLAKMTTGMGLRDKHMHEKYLETGKNPEATLVLDGVDYAEGKPQAFCGQLTLKAETFKVCGNYTYAPADGKLEVTFKASLANYPSVGVPSWAGVTVADTVDVRVDGVVKR